MGNGNTGGGTTLPGAIVPGTVLATGADACSDALMDAMVDVPASSSNVKHTPQSPSSLDTVAAAHFNHGVAQCNNKHTRSSPHTYVIRQHSRAVDWLPLVKCAKTASRTAAFKLLTRPS
jgi:hypothetical protein